MNQPNPPRFHEVPTALPMSQTETKYKNMRNILLMTLILSAVNCVSLLVADMFFYVSAYLPLLIIAFGAQYTAVTGASAFYIVSAVLSMVILVPYLLCYIFSKKHVGWMIAAMSLFAVDTLLLGIDLIAAFNSTLLICMVFHVYILVMLIMGVKYGLSLKKEKEAAGVPMDGQIPEMPFGQPGTEYVPNPDGTYEYVNQSEYANVTRTVTVNRKKSFVGCAVPFAVYIGGQQVALLKNGQSATLEVTGESFVLRAGSTNGMVVGEIVVPAGEQNLTYEVVMKTGFVTNTLEFTQVL